MVIYKYVHMWMFVCVFSGYDACGGMTVVVIVVLVVV